MRNEIEGKQMQISTMMAGKDEFVNKARVEIHAEYQIIIDSMNESIMRSQAMFSLQDKTTGLPAICPIPTKSGFIDSFRNIMLQWMAFPCDNEGELHASFRCSVTGIPTAIASVEQLNLIRGIAFDLNLAIKPPLYLEYANETTGQWEEFSFIEQVVMISKICKIYRRKAADCSIDHLIVANGNFLLTFHFQSIGDGQWSMGMRLMPLMAKSIPATRMVLTEPLAFEGLHFTNFPASQSPSTGDEDSPSTSS
jgi:hypothetical protein